MTSCRKFAMIIGCNFSGIFWFASRTVFFNQSKVILWCAWSLRDAVISKFTSGVMVGGVQ